MTALNADGDLAEAQEELDAWRALGRRINALRFSESPAGIGDRLGGLGDWLEDLLKETVRESWSKWNDA